MKKAKSPIAHYSQDKKIILFILLGSEFLLVYLTSLTLIW